MFDLRLLGAPQIVGPKGPLVGRGAQRRRIAILALLGCAPGNILSRDKLIAYLWPESSTDVARHRLSVALHELRRALGETAVISRGDDVLLDPGVVRVDVAQFEASSHAADWAAAVALYQGPLLDGFFLDGAPEFEEWAEGARVRYGHMYADALHQLASAAAQRGDHAGELAARRQLAAHDPLSTPAALQLIKALCAAGERSAALQHGRHHAERLREEFDAEPDAQFMEYMAQLRLVSDAAPARSAPTSHAPLIHALAQNTRRRSSIMAVAVLAVLALGGWTAWSTLANSEVAPVTRIAVLPFAVSGTGLEYLGDGMVDLLSTNMNDAGDIRTIDPHALFDALADRATLSSRIKVVREQLGATSYISGSIYVAGDRLRVNALLYSADSGRLLSSATVDGKQDNIFPIVDEITTQLIGNAFQQPGDRPVRIAAATTRSIPALKAYLAGERAFRSGRFVTAIDEFARAAMLDSTFAIANYRLALSMLWADVPDTLPFEPEARALRHSGKLPAHDQQLIRAFVAWRNGDADEAERIYRGIVRLYPDDSEAWLQLGETLYHYNPLTGRNPAEADYAFARAAALDPESWAAIWHRALIAGATRDTRSFRALVSQLKTMEPEPAQLLELNAVDAYMRNDAGAIARLDQELKRTSPLQLFQIAWRISTLAHDARAAEHLVGLAIRQQNANVLIQGYSAMASLAAARGDRTAVDAALTSLARHDGDGLPSRVTRASMAVIPSMRYSRAELERIYTDLVSAQPGSPGETLIRLHAMAMMAAHLGRNADLRAHTHEFDRSVTLADNPKAHAGSLAGLRARVALAEGRKDEALVLLGSGRNEVWFGWSIGSTYWSQVSDRYLRAELLRDAGRLEEAERWYQSIEQFSVNDLAYLGAAKARRAEMKQRLEARTQARP